MTIAVLFLVVLLVAIGYWCWLKDTGHRPQIKRFVLSLLFVLVMARAVIYAAEVQIYGCQDYEKYSAWWYLSGCFLYEHSS